MDGKGGGWEGRWMGREVVRRGGWEGVDERGWMRRGWMRRGWMGGG